MQKAITSNEDLCATLKEIREARGLSLTALATQRTIAEGYKVATTRIRGLEDAKTSPTARVLIEHLKSLGAKIIIEW